MRFLNLKSANLSSLGVQRIAEISTLTSLSLREVEFDDVLFKALCEQGRIEIFNLVIARPRVTTKSLAELASLPKLRFLGLPKTVTLAEAKLIVPQCNGFSSY